MQNNKDVVKKKGNVSPLPNTVQLLEIKNVINRYDLTSVYQRLVHIEKWLPKTVNAAMVQYRNFLFLKRKYGHLYKLPPSYEIDEVWHAHILHTKDYQQFCAQVFNDYLHHDPHYSESANDINQLNALFSQTQMLYRHEFGQYIFALRPFRLIRMINAGLKQINRAMLKVIYLLLYSQLKPSSIYLRRKHDDNTT